MSGGLSELERTILRRSLEARRTEGRNHLRDTERSTPRRGRPVDPRLADLDDLIVSIVEKFRRINCRGVFYQLVKLNAVEKIEGNSKLTERRLLKLRREGRIPYDRIVDESRIVYGTSRYGGLSELAEDAAALYRRDYWIHSDVAVQVWIEKRGLASLLHPVVVGRWGLNLYCAAGQMSESYLYVAGTEIARLGKPTYVYAMTDFDPGGATIFDTLKNGSKKAPGGLSRFTQGVPVYVEQIALTADQVAAWKLPTRPAKKTDVRSKKFIERHGDVSTELDAIDPPQLRGLVEDAIARHLTRGDLERLKLVEDSERQTLSEVLSSLGQDGGDVWN